MVRKNKLITVGKTPLNIFETGGFKMPSFKENPDLYAGIGSAGVTAVNKVLNGNASNAVGNTFNTLGDVGMMLPGPYKFIGVGLKGLGFVANGFTNSVNKEYQNLKNQEIANLGNEVSNASDYQMLQQDFDNMYANQVDLGSLNDWGSKGFLSSGSKRRNAFNNARTALGIANNTRIADMNQRGLFINKRNTFGQLGNLTALGGYIGPVGIMQNDKYIDAINKRSTALSKEKNLFPGGGQMASFLDHFKVDPIKAAVDYINSRKAMTNIFEEAEASGRREKEFQDVQRRLAAAETQNQGLQALLDSQGLSIQNLMNQQLQNNYADNWEQRMNPSAAPNDTAVMARMRKSLIDRGVDNRAHQDAIIANMMVESSGNPNARNPKSSARGLMQWLTGRQPKAWDWDSQVDHIVNTYNKFGGDNWLDKEAYNKFMNTTDSTEAARLFRRYWERPEAATYNFTDKYINQMYSKKAFGGNIYATGGSEGDILGLKVPSWAETAASFTPILGTAMDIKNAIEDPSLANIGTAGLSLLADLSGASIVRGALKASSYANKLKKAEKAVHKAAKTAGKTEDYSRLNKAQEDLSKLQKEILDSDVEMYSAIPEKFLKGYPVVGDAGLNAKQHGMFETKIKAFGGELGTNGTDFTNGIIEINAGDTHENNPMQGVPMGIDENGVPNLVEEGETVFNDYVFSKRMMVPDFMHKELGLGGVIKDGISFADASKKIAEESTERPNDPISIDGLKAGLSKLAQVQEAERMRIQAEEDNAAMEMGLMAACGGKLNKMAYGGIAGNIFEGKGNKPNRMQIVPDERSWTRRMFGDNAFTDFVEDPVDYIAGDQIDAALSKIKDMSEPQLQKFFNTSIGQRVAQFLVDTDSEEGSNYIEAGKFPGKKAAKLFGRAHKSIVNTARKSLKDVRGRKPTNNTGTDLVKASPRGVANTASNTGLSTIGNNSVGFTSPRFSSGYAGANNVLPTTALATRGATGLTTPSTFRRWDIGPLAEAALIAGTGSAAYDFYQNHRGTPTNDLAAGVAIGNLPGSAYSSPAPVRTKDANSTGEADNANNARRPTNTTVGRTPAAGNTNATPSPANNRMVSGLDNLIKGQLNDYQLLPKETPIERATQEDFENAGITPADTPAWNTTPSNPIKPLPTWMRDVPIWVNGALTLSDALGITNNPDYTYANKIEAEANRLGYAPNIGYTPIGEAVRPEYLDINYTANRMLDNSAGMRRDILNSNNSAGARNAMMLAQNAQDQINLAEALRQSQQYNSGQRFDSAGFNMRRDSINSQMGLEAAMANARFRQMAANSRLSGLAQAAAMREAIDQRVGAARSANLTNFLTSLSNLGRENFAMNQINSDRGWNYATQRNGQSVWKGTNQASKGGKLRKKK